MNQPTTKTAHCLPSHAYNYPAELDQLLRPEGRLIPAPAADLARFDQRHLSVFCHQWAYYCLPTTELIDWLRAEIGDRRAIEIGAGNGATGRALGIPMTDSYLQDGTNKTVARYYQALGQPMISYPDDVRKLSANSAVIALKPQVVVGCWITHKMQDRFMDGNYWGVDEGMLMQSWADTYIHVGHEDMHHGKPLLRTHPPRVVKAPWLFSRAMRADGNVIYVFETQRR